MARNCSSLSRYSKWNRAAIISNSLLEPLSLVDRQSRIAEHVRSQRLALDREKSFARFQERQITHHRVTSVRGYTVSCLA